MLKTGGFWHRFLTAVVSATLVFSPFYIYLFLHTVSQRVQYESPWVTFLNGLDVFALGQAVIVAAVLVIAYPVERFFNSDSKSNFRNAATYFFIGILTGTILLITAIATIGSGNYFLAYGIYIAFFGTIVAFLGRLIYPTMLKRKYLVTVFSNTIMFLVLGALLIQPLQAASPAADGFYPKTFEHEVVRATNDVDESNGSGGSHTSVQSGEFDPNLQYKLTYQCRDDNGARFNALIRESENLMTLSVTEITCSSTNVVSRSVNLGKKPVKVTMILEPLGIAGNLNGVSSHPDTWAVLAPTLAN
ncbi:MAG: hypothetical protein RL101_609 [Actinomycetota bacterium]|jgi:hypothetical protein